MDTIGQVDAGELKLNGNCFSQSVYLVDIWTCPLTPQTLTLWAEWVWTPPLVGWHLLIVSSLVEKMGQQFFLCMQPENSPTVGPTPLNKCVIHSLTIYRHIEYYNN